MVPYKFPNTKNSALLAMGRSLNYKAAAEYCQQLNRGDDCEQADLATFVRSGGAHVMCVWMIHRLGGA